MQTQAANPLLTAALSYAAGGFAVFPTHDVVFGKCSCGAGCSSPGKHPRTPHGFKDSTTDPVQIAQWWSRWPHANIGIDCGKSNLYVADVDTKKGAQGAATIRWFVERFPEFAQTLLIGTPTGGHHYYFRGTGPGRDLGPGINVRSIGGYVLAPPSVAPSQYDENGQPTAGAVQAYRVERQAPILAMPLKLTPTTEEPGDTMFIGPVEESTGDERETVPYGSHRTAILQWSWHLRKNQGLSVEAALPLVRMFIESGILEGYNPANPWSDNDLRKELRNVPANVNTKPPPSAVKSLAESLTPAHLVILERPPLRQHFITGLILQGELHVFYGEPGVGKTTIVAYELAWITQQGHDVLVFINEDSPRDFALSFHYAGGDLSKLIFQNANVREMLLPKDGGELETIVASRQWGAIYFDSIGDVNAADPKKHAGDQARALYKPLGNLAKRYNTTIICTAHTNKAGILEGAKQIEAKARVIARITRPKPPSSDDATMNVTDITHDPVWTAVVTTEKFSRGKKGTRYAFHFETVPSADPYTGEVDQEIDEHGQLVPIMQYVAKWHEKLETLEEAIPDPKPTSVDLRERIAKVYAENPTWSNNRIRDAIGCRGTTVTQIMRELRPTPPPTSVPK